MVVNIINLLIIVEHRNHILDEKKAYTYKNKKSTKIHMLSNLIERSALLRNTNKKADKTKKHQVHLNTPMRWMPFCNLNTRLITAHSVWKIKWLWFNSFSMKQNNQLRDESTVFIWKPTHASTCVECSPYTNKYSTDSRNGSS